LIELTLTISCSGRARASRHLEHEAVVLPDKGEVKV
jgi:hypothetical protein